MSNHYVRIWLTLVALQAARLAGQAAPAGPEFQVNTYTTYDQYGSAVASDAQGNFVVVWWSRGSMGTDTSDRSIQAQRVAANGVPLAGELQVNTYTTSIQFNPEVALDSLGNFVVVWASYGSSGTDSDEYSIQGQRYVASGAPLGGEFQVNSYTTRSQKWPAMAVDALGNFIVVWESNGASGTDTSSSSIQAQRYAANGAPLGGQFQVNTYTTGNQYRPAMALDAQSNFVVVWQSMGSSGTDTSERSIQAQLYDASGLPLGGEFQVNTYTTSFQVEPEVASDAQGNFVVVWWSNGASGTDMDLSSIQAQRYAANGAPLGGELQVNTYTTGGQARPAVASDAQGNFAIVWASNGSSGTDTDGFSILGQRFAANGAPLGDEFQVNTYTTSSQSRSTVTSNGQGDFVVAWDSRGSSGTDTGSSFSIQAQRYDGLFRDGFESGTTGRWSSTVP